MNADLISRILAQNDRALSQMNEIIIQNKEFIKILSAQASEALSEDSTVAESEFQECEGKDDSNTEISSISSADSDETYVPSSCSSSSDESSVFQSKNKNKNKKSKRKLTLFYIIEEQESYTSDEIAGMDNYHLLSEFIRITGKEKLYCAHCKKETPLEFWIHSIRKRCLKKDGLCYEMAVPKTCDKQQAVNSICNPVNNRLYPVLRSTEYNQEIKQRMLEAKGELFVKIAKEINPYKY